MSANQYDVTTIVFADEPFVTDVAGNPSESLHPALDTFMDNWRLARDEAEARKLRAKGGAE